MASFIERHFGRPMNDFLALNHEQRPGAARSAIADLNFFFDEGLPIGARETPRRTCALAMSLRAAVARVGDPAMVATLRERIVPDSLVRGEADRDPIDCAATASTNRRRTVEEATVASRHKRD